MNIFTSSFAIYAIERAGKTFFQAGLGALVANQTGLVAVEWKAILWLSLLAAAGSLLTSINGYTSPLTSAVKPADLPAVLPVATHEVAPVIAPVFHPAVGFETPKPEPVTVVA